MANSTSNVLPNLGNDPPEESPSTRVLSNRELRELRKKEKKAKELKEMLEVRSNPHLFRQHITPPQREERETELRCEREEREALGLKEKLEVSCDRYPSLVRSDVLIPR